MRLRLMLKFYLLDTTFRNMRFAGCLSAVRLSSVLYKHQRSSTIQFQLSCDARRTGEFQSRVFSLHTNHSKSREFGFANVGWKSRSYSYHMACVACFAHMFMHCRFSRSRSSILERRSRLVVKAQKDRKALHSRFRILGC